MFGLRKLMDAVTMGEPKRLYPTVGWTLAEYFFRGAPYATMVVIVWEVFRPLQTPGVPLDYMRIWLAALGLLVSTVCLWFIGKRSYTAAYGEGYHICCDGRLRAVDHLRRMPMGFYNSRDPGEVGAYVVSDYELAEMLTTHLIGQIYGALAMPVLLLAVLFAFNWKLALAALRVLPLAYPAMALSGYVGTRMARKLQKTKRVTNARIIEYIQGMRLIKAFNLGGERFRRLEMAFQELKRRSLMTEVAPAPIFLVARLVLNGGTILVILLGLTMMLHHEMSLPVYIVFLLASTAVYAPLANALVFYAEMRYMAVGVDHLSELFKMPHQPEGEECTVEGHDIEFRNVHFRYNSVPVLKGISLRIPERKLTALVGPSGSGKTTLTRLIARFWDVEQGEILLGGKDVRAYKLDALMRQIAIVFQDVYLFRDTVYNNIRIGRESASRDEIIEAAKVACCHDFIMSLPEGYDTMVGEGGSTLSGGERQRISIARAILKDAPIVLLDEATASLDPENEVHIQEAIENLIRSKTVVVIAHRLGTVVHADNIAVIDHGTVVQQGRHEELMAQGGLYRSLWDEQERIKGWRF